MFTDLKINTDLPKVPAQGFYVTLEWMFGGIAGAIAQLTQFTAQYRDGIIADPYNVILS